MSPGYSKVSAIKAGVKKVVIRGKGLSFNLKIRSLPHPFLIKENIFSKVYVGLDKSLLG